ncbi:MAG: hypothetical protein EOO53_21455 [Gammaproteobacteria bacterium]|nr:MAG: hypothetical protein EOO53_21455 [Gammaproteobacteria bacterium]
MADNQTDELIFEVNLLFRESKNAIEAFNQIIKFYEVLNDFDKAIVRNIGQNIVTAYELEGVEFSSIKTKLSQALKAIPDDLIKDFQVKKAIGYLLIKVKYWFIKLLADEKDIASKDQIEKVTDKINNEIKELGNTYQIIITEINNYTVLNSIDELAKEANNLKEKELLEYKSKAGNTFISKGIHLNKPKILSELGQTTIVNETTEILKIKKVDMLSDEPKWDFLQGKRNLSAKMLDKQWLEDFHNRQVIIKPEDALMVTLRTTHTYTPNFEDKKTECEIIKIISVITPENDNINQMKISDDL